MISDYHTPVRQANTFQIIIPSISSLNLNSAYSTFVFYNFRLPYSCKTSKHLSAPHSKDPSILHSSACTERRRFQPCPVHAVVLSTTSAWTLPALLPAVYQHSLRSRAPVLLPAAPDQRLREPAVSRASEHQADQSIIVVCKDGVRDGHPGGGGGVFVPHRHRRAGEYGRDDAADLSWVLSQHVGSGVIAAAT